jgi:hypothetical protein
MLVRLAVASGMAGKHADAYGIRVETVVLLSSS